MVRNQTAYTQWRSVRLERRLDALVEKERLEHDVSRSHIFNVALRKRYAEELKKEPYGPPGTY